jgi:rhodanese-related sulfurtransferase
MKIVYRLCQLVVVLFLFTTFIGCATLKKEDLLDDNQKTDLGLYLTSIEAYDLVKTDSENILFVDLRSHAEVNSFGVPTPVDAHVPYQFRKKIEGKKKSKWVPNNNFVAALEEQLNQKGLDKESTIILMCRNGRRSAKAVNKLAKVGYKKVYTVTDGTVDGWKANNLPWTEKKSDES